MKKKKLSLNELKVKSFVTSSEGMNAETVKGGTRLSVVIICQIQTVRCPIVTLKCPSLICPSAVDGCPSAPAGCTFDTSIIETIGDTSVINPIG